MQEERKKKINENELSGSELLGSNFSNGIFTIKQVSLNINDTKPSPTTVNNIEFKLGDKVVGHDKNGKEIIGDISKIEKDEDNEIISIIIQTDKTNKTVSLLPTTVSLYETLNQDYKYKNIKSINEWIKK